MPSLTVDTPVSAVTLTETDGVLTRLAWQDHRRPEDRRDRETTAVLAEAARQLQAYFDHRLTLFDLPLARLPGLTGAVQERMSAIPFGQTRTYGEIARALGAPAQAIGQACGANPLPILIPCHRVLGACGLGGYSGAGGIETKVALLRHECAAGLLI